MKKILVLLTVLVGMAFCANTLVVADSTTGVASRVNAYGNGSATKVTATGAATNATLNVTGAGWYQIEAASLATAVTTVNSITGGTEGDVIVLSTFNATRDAVIIDGGTLKIGGDRVLDNLSDTLSLIYSGSNWYELGFVNND